MTDALAAIRARRSCRTFESRPLQPADRSTIEQVLADRTVGPFGSRLRFRLLDAGRAGAVDSPLARWPGRSLGTYGVVRGAPCFIAGAVVRGGPDLLDFGWAMEEIVLELTERGYGSCWLAGTFSRSRFAESIGLATDELLPAVTPVGHPRTRPSLVDAVFRAGAASSRRRSWSELFFDGEIGRPLSEGEAGPWAPCLEAVRLAPSASNAQPWRIIRRAGGSELRLLVVGGGTAGSWRRLDAGIALCHFALAARQLKLPGSWRLFDPPTSQGGLLEVATWLGAR